MANSRRPTASQFYGVHLQAPEDKGCPIFWANSLTAWAQARFAQQVPSRVPLPGTVINDWIEQHRALSARALSGTDSSSELLLCAAAKSEIRALD